MNMAADAIDGGNGGAESESITTSVSRVVKGFIAQFGGEEAWGKELAKIAMDVDMPSGSRVSVHNAVLKIMATHLEDEETNDPLVGTEQIEAMLKKLAAQE